MIALGRSAAMMMLLALAVGCSFGTKQRPTFDYRPYVARDPRSVVVAPMGDLQVERHFLATIAQPLAERGYYVMPIRMTQEIASEEGYLERHRELRSAWIRSRESLWDEVDLDKLPEAKQMARELAALFGVDSVLFVHIVTWDEDLVLDEGFLANMIDEKKDHTIDLEYLLTDAQGERLWQGRKRIVFRRGGGNFFKEMWNAARKPTDEEIRTALARDVNRVMIESRRSRNKFVEEYFQTFPMLVGPYHAAYEADRARRAAAVAP